MENQAGATTATAIAVRVRLKVARTIGAGCGWGGGEEGGGETGDRPGGVPGGGEGVPGVGDVVHAVLVRLHPVGQDDRWPARVVADIHAVGDHGFYQLGHEVLGTLGWMDGWGGREGETSREGETTTRQCGFVVWAWNGMGWIQWHEKERRQLRMALLQPYYFAISGKAKRTYSPRFPVLIAVDLSRFQH